MSSSSILFEDLEKKIVEPGFCVSCGVCEAACPVHGIKLEKGLPVRIYECSNAMTRCTTCYDICPHTEALLPNLDKFVSSAPFKKDGIGSYRRILLARTMNPRVERVCQDGGVVTSLLIYTIDKKIVDSAIVTKADVDVVVMPKPSLALVPDDVLSAAGSKFFPAAVASAYGKAAYEYWKPRIAFVGTPCQVRGIRKLEAWQHRLADSLEVVIGLFCLWTFSFDNLLRSLKDKYGVKSSDVKRFNLTEDAFVVHTAKDVIRIPLAEALLQIMDNCRFCTDFTAELADISVGRAGPLERWSTIIVRTEKGEKLLNDLEKSGAIKTILIEDKPEVLASVLEMAKMKSTTAIEAIRKRTKEKKELPPIAEKIVKG